LPPSPTPTRRGAPRNKDVRIGSPTTLAQTATGWAPHPREAGAESHAWDGLWPPGWPGRRVRVGVRRRQSTRATTRPGQSKPRPAIAAFVTTALTLSAEALVRAYGHRWTVAMALRDANACAGLGPEQCRKRHRIVGAQTFRVGMAAARTLGGIDQIECGMTCKRCD